MRRMVSVFLLSAIVLFGMVCGGQSQDSLIGREAPGFVLRDLDGKTVSLREFKGKVILLGFWATWCKPCRRELAELEKIHQTYKAEGLAIVGVTLDQSAGKARDYLDGIKVTFPNLLATRSMASNYGIMVIPTAFIIDRAGIVTRVLLGFPTEPGEIKERIDNLERELSILLRKAPPSSDPGGPISQPL